DIPFEKIVDEVQPLRDLSRSPVFQVLLVFQNTQSVTPTFSGMKTEVIDVKYRNAKLDLSMYLTESDIGISGWLEYNCNLFGPDRIERMAGDFEALLEAIVRHPGQYVSETRPLVSEGQMNGNHRSGLHAAAEPHLFSGPGTASIQLLDAGDSQGGENGRVFLAPRTPTERAVAAAWAKVLNLDEISIADKFFEIGGDSLRLVHVFLELNVQYSGKLAVVDLFTHNTVASLSSHIDAVMGDSSADKALLQTYEL
ncbi:MAG: condensation domain-containing protein, partial [Candidatus Angelobacter sp.]